MIRQPAGEHVVDAIFDRPVAVGSALGIRDEDGIEIHQRPPILLPA